MKKYLVIGSMLSGLMFTNVASVQAMDKSTEQTLIKICEALKSNNKGKLHRVVKHSYLNYKQISKGLVCNGMDPVTFALRNSATDTAELFARRSNMDYDMLLAKR